MSDKAEERGVSSALGSIPQQNNQRAFNSTITIVGTGTGDITIQDVVSAIKAQNTIANSNVDQLYIHGFRVYGTAGGYLSVAPYPHRQYAISPQGGALPNAGSLCNAYEYTTGTDTSGALTQMYGKWNLQSLSI